MYAQHLSACERMRIFGDIPHSLPLLTPVLIYLFINICSSKRDCGTSFCLQCVLRAFVLSDGIVNWKQKLFTTPEIKKKKYICFDFKFFSFFFIEQQDGATVVGRPYPPSVKKQQ
jgi:hypothetical protein